MSVNVVSIQTLMMKGAAGCILLVLGLVFGSAGCSMVPYDAEQARGAQYASRLTELQSVTVDLPGWVEYQHHETITFLPADQQGGISAGATGFLIIRDLRWDAARIIPVTNGSLHRLGYDESRVEPFHEAWVVGTELLVARRMHDGYSTASIGFQLFGAESVSHLDPGALLPPPPSGERIIRAATVSWHSPEAGEPTTTLLLITVDTATSQWREFQIPWQVAVGGDGTAIAGPSVFTIENSSELPHTLHYIVLDEETDEEMHTRSVLTWETEQSSGAAGASGVTWSSAAPPGGEPAPSLESLETELPQPLVWATPRGELFTGRSGTFSAFAREDDARDDDEVNAIFEPAGMRDIGTLYAARTGLSADGSALAPWYTVAGITRAFGGDRRRVITLAVYHP